MSYCRRYEADDRARRRNRHSALGHRPQRAHRLQRAVQPAQQPHAAGHARPGDAQRRGQRFLQRGERAARKPLTMGLGTILDARKIVLIALGEHKAGDRPRGGRRAAHRRACRPACCAIIPMRRYSLDEAAAGQLTGLATPWLVGPVEWTDPMIKRAVLWLIAADRQGAAQSSTTHDFRDHNLHKLLRHHGPAQSAGPSRFPLDDGHDRVSSGRSRGASESSASARIRTTT